MRAENETTGHSRSIIVSDICEETPTLTIRVAYEETSSATNGIILDHTIIPRILVALNDLPRAFIFKDTKAYSLHDSVVLATSEQQARELLCLETPELSFLFRDSKRFPLVATKELVQGVLHTSEYHE